MKPSLLKFPLINSMKESGRYFDGSGNPHYYVTDWQGNNIGVVDRNGLLEQRTDYYPYGEPWLEPEATMSGQGSVVIRPGLPVSAEEGAQDIEATAASSSGSDASVNVFLFGDKERTRSGGLNEYRFPARDYVPGFPRFTTVDPLAEKTPWLSPYAYCAANPVMLVDPTGGNPIYNSNGEFMGVDERGLQGLPVMMDVNDFKNGMSHDEAVVKSGKVRFSAETWNKVKEHHAQLPNRPDYDGFVTIEEGVRWAKDHPGAMDNPAPDNILYIDASQLDFGNLSADEFPSENVQRPVNLFNLGNTVKSAVNERLRATVYALGRCMMVLHDRNARTVSVVNDEATDYDWNRGDGAMRNIFLIVDNYINGLNPETHGFKTFYYGIGVLNQ